MDRLDEVVPKVDLPEGRSGDWSVERFEVTEADAARHNASFRVGRRTIAAGTYTRLLRGRELVMSDVPAERSDHAWFVGRAEGDVLVTGLGLGMVVGALLLRPGVRTVTVVEVEADVVALTAPHLAARWGDRVEVVLADAYDWRPPKGRTWDSAWHDVWPGICSDNLAGMTRLKRRFARRVGRSECWAEHECRARAA